MPSVSSSRVKLWSYTDLMALRMISWLRHPKTATDGQEVRPSTMRVVRGALTQLRDLDLELWTEERGPSVAVDRGGRVVLDPLRRPEMADGQTLASTEVLDLVHPFPGEAGIQGPDLFEPRPQLRIVPGKLAGSPHIARSRVETQALAALARRGMHADKIVQLYPFLDETAVVEAVDLESQLTKNLALAA